MLACILSCGCRAATHVEEQQKAVRGTAPGWLGILSEHIFLPQFNLPGAQVIALLLTKRSFDAFPHPQPFHFAIYSLLHSLLAVFEIGHRDMYKWKTKGEIPNCAVTINGRASNQRVRLIMPNPD